MFRVLVTDKSLDGYHAGLVLQRRGDVADFFVPSKLHLTTVPVDRLRSSIEVELRPLIVRTMLKKKVEEALTNGYDMPPKAVIDRVMDELGAGERTRSTMMKTKPSERVVARRAKAAEKRDRAARGGPTVAEVTEVIRARVDGETDRAQSAGRALPDPQTKSRVFYDLMVRPEGATNREVCEAGGYDPRKVSMQDRLRQLGARYGFVIAKQKVEGRGTVMRFAAVPDAPEAEAAGEG